MGFEEGTATPAFGTALVVLCALVLLMQIGFALIEVGSVRSKNATSILLKNVLDTVVGTISFLFIGYALCKGTPPGGNPFMALNANNILVINTKTYVDVYYLLSFACVCCTIMSGALAERAFHGPCGLYSGVVAGFIFPTVAYWTWSTSGWLFKLGYLDTAGSSVVHVVGGAGAMVVAKLIGPRAGRYDDFGKVQPILGHSMPLMATGGLIIWLGCFSFNASSVLVSASARYANDLDRVNFLIGRCCVNVLSSTSCGFLTLYGLSRYTPKTRLSKCLNGTISGGVAICAGCMVFSPWAAGITGCLAGLVYLGVSLLMAKLRIDDPVDAVAVHFGGGATGVLSVALFANDTNYKGIFYGGWRLLLVQPVGLMAITAWTISFTTTYWLIARKLVTIRIPPQAEQEGLDIVLGVEPAYPENYAMGDFLKFREFLETSWIATEARVAMEVFSRRQGAAGLSRAYYTTDASNILETDRATYRARRGSVPNITSNSSQNSIDNIPPRKRSGSCASAPFNGDADSGVREATSDPPTRALNVKSFFGRKGKQASEASPDENCVVLNISPPLSQSSGVSPSASSLHSQVPPRARVPAPPLPPLPQAMECTGVASEAEKDFSKPTDV